MGTHPHEPLLVNILGHAAGTLIFGIFFYLLLRDRAGARLAGGRLPLAAAGLALVWNLGSLVAMAAPGAAGIDLLFSFAAISLLPAVLLHLCLGARFRLLWIAGYAVGLVSIGVHLSEFAAFPAERHALALRAATAGFGVLSAAAAAGILLRPPRDKRTFAQSLVASLCVFLFALSFVHFDPAHAEHAWSRELAVHHAGIPLALLVLLQDHRFLLLDAFVRFLANVFLAAVFLFAAGAAALKFAGPPLAAGDPVHQGLLFASGSLLLVLFAVLRGKLQDALTRLVFRRPSIDNALARLRAASAVESETAFLQSTLDELARFMGAASAGCAPGELHARLAHTGLASPTLASDVGGLREQLYAAGAEVVVPVNVSGEPAAYFLLGRRRGGRRYLSEDLAALARLGRVAEEQLERNRRVEARRLMAQAELRALHAQINPHFLFNALNTLYGVIPKTAGAARRLVLNLADVFRYCLQSQRTLVSLEEELKIVKAYLEIEQERLGGRLQTELDVPPEALTAAIPALSIQPLVENAVKHGIAPNPAGGRVRLTVCRAGPCWRITVEDTGAGGRHSESAHGGLALENVNRRLQLCYGSAAAVQLEKSGKGAVAWFEIPAGAEGASA